MGTVDKILTLIFSDEIVNVQLGLTLAASQRAAIKDKILSSFIDRLLWSCCTDESISIIKDKTCWYGPNFSWVTINGRVGTWCITIKLDTTILDDIVGMELLDGDRCSITYQYAPHKLEIEYRCLYTAIHFKDGKLSVAYRQSFSVRMGYRGEDATGTYCTLTDKSCIHKHVSYMGVRNSRKIYRRLLKLITRDE